MGEILQFAGQYWWLVFAIGPVVGGWFAAAAKYNERRRRDRIELERVRRGHPVAAAPESQAVSAPAQSAQSDIDRVLADHDAIEQRWLSYELDAAKLIDFPLMTDMREQVTRDFHTAKRRADGLRPSDTEVLREPVRLAAYRDAVTDFETAFDIALGEAKRRRQQDFSGEERGRLDTARKLLGIAADEAATQAERQSAYRQARKQLDGIIVLPDATTDDLEHRIAGALGR